MPPDLRRAASGPPARPRLRRIALAVLLGCGALWHGLPHWTWRLAVEPELAAHPAGDRLEVRHVVADHPIPAHFAAIEHAGLLVWAPIPSDTRLPLCPPAPAACQIPLSRGRLVIHATPPGEDFWAMVWMRAPDRRDLSWRRSAGFNWRSIAALRTRVTSSRSKLDSWRYESSHTRGLVVRTTPGTSTNHLIAAYARDDSNARVLGVSNAPDDVLLAILSSLEFREPAPKRH